MRTNARLDFALVDISTYREPRDFIPISPIGESIAGPINPITVTLTARKPWGRVTVSATACGPNDTSLAGWKAFTSLVNLKPGLSGEDSFFAGDRWETRPIEQEGPTMADNVTTLKSEPQPNPVDEVIKMIEDDTISTGDRRRLQTALTGSTMRDSGGVLGALLGKKA